MTAYVRILNNCVPLLGEENANLLLVSQLRGFRL